MHQITWTCSRCAAEVEDHEGSLRVNSREAYDRAMAVREWEETHEDPETHSISMTAARVLETMPMLVTWDVAHYSCAGDGIYEFDVSRLRGPWELLDATAHLLESKNWLHHTNWHTVLWTKIKETRAGSS